MKPISRRAFLRSLAAGTLFVGGGPLVYGSAVEPNTLDITELTIAIPGLGSRFDGMRAVHLSDLHAGLWTDKARLMDVFEKARDLKPDLALITGDFLTKGSDYEQGADDLIAALPILSGTAPIYAVRGNHDHGERETALSEVFAQTGIFELANAIQTIHRAGDMLHIAGVDSISTGHQGLGPVVKAAPTDAPVILLVHEPDMAEFSAPSGKFALQISGHSHGGQINLPFIRRLMLPWMAEKYPAGLYRVGTMWQYTNRGIGMTHLPFRINCPPEITVYTFVPA